MRSNLLRREYAQRYKLTEGQARWLRKKILEQLEKCPNETARRLLLGKGNAA